MATPPESQLPRSTTNDSLKWDRIYIQVKMDDHRFTDTILRATNVQSAIQRFEKRAPAPPPPFKEPEPQQNIQSEPTLSNSYDAPLFVNTNITYPIEENSYFPQITPPREHVTYGVVNDSALDASLENISANRFETGFKPTNFGKTIQGIYNSTEHPQNTPEVTIPSSLSINLSVMPPRLSPPKPAERRKVAAQTIEDNSVSLPFALKIFQKKLPYCILQIYFALLLPTE
ncbi:unnamed protein product [Caenorhabditis brenneri]